ncbi:MAG: SufE family protein [Bacteroidales bacterium]|nr:SufE family protein [Bacteroidales bacterium]
MIEEIRKPEEIAEDIVEEFSVFDEWLDKYEYLIELGGSLPMIEETEKTDDKLIAGCQSRVWLACEYRDGRIWFTADSDAIITKGIISLLIRVYNGQKPEDIAGSDFGFIERIGLRENLSPTRANGLVSMIERIKEYAREYESR